MVHLTYLAGHTIDLVTWLRELRPGAVLAPYPDERVVIVAVSNSGELAGGLPVSHTIARDLAEIIIQP